MNEDLFRTYEAGCLLASKFPLLGESLDGFEGNSVISTYAPALRPANPWRSQLVENSKIVSVAFWQERKLRCVLNLEGNTNLYGPGGRPDIHFQIPDTGVFTETATGLGYVNRIRAIGNHLYVCGQSRQIWRFDFDGKDLSTGHWQDAAGDMRQPPMPELDEDLEGDELDAWLDEHDNAVDLVDIHGTAEDDIYAVGDEAWHWNGESWQQLNLPTDEPLSAIEIVSAEQIYLVGHNGTVLVGNAQDGFVDLSGIEDNQDFIGVAWFQDALYLAAPDGLYRYDAQARKITPYQTGLTPELQDAHMLEAKDGVLWSFGFKDLAWFDGSQWTRVDHPDNPPIR